MIFFSSPQNVFPFLLAHLLFLSLVHFFLFSFPCFHVSPMITPLNLPNCLYQPVYVRGWTPPEVRKPTAGGLPMPPGAGLGMKASRGFHGSSSWQQAPCSLQSKPVLHGSRQSRWLRLVVHPFNKAATGNITQPGPQDLAAEWQRQTGSSQVTVNDNTAVYKPAWNLPQSAHLSSSPCLSHEN